MKEILTNNALHKEIQVWMELYGRGRNDKDLRFGQYICNKYDVQVGNSYEEEDAAVAFVLIRNSLSPATNIKLNYS